MLTKSIKKIQSTNLQVVLTEPKRVVRVAKEICARTTYYTHNGKLFPSTGVQLGRTNSFLSPSNKITLGKVCNTRAHAAAARLHGKLIRFYCGARL
jgi:hypothetical protein